MLDENFFLPAASKTAHHQLNEAARQLVHSYVNDYDDGLRRVWETERPFELHLPAAIISGRADVILDRENGEVRSLAIVDPSPNVSRRSSDLSGSGHRGVCGAEPLLQPSGVRTTPATAGMARAPSPRLREARRKR
jgi:hypothetical protein